MTSQFTAAETFTASADRTFGVEIEFKSPLTREQIAQQLRNAGIDCQAEGYNHQTRSHWKVIYDASVVNGHELVSPPMSFDDSSFRQIEIVCQTLTELGARIDKQCGLHVHHDARDLSDRQIVKTVALYAKHEAYFDEILPQSRRGTNNLFLKSLNVRGDLKSTVKTITACKTREELKAVYSDRYYKLNVHSLFRHGTLEFRHHSGTIEAAKIVNWIKITRAMVERGANAKSVTVRNDTPNVDRFFRLTFGKELATYARTRRAQLN